MTHIAILFGDAQLMVPTQALHRESAFFASQPHLESYSVQTDVRLETLQEFLRTIENRTRLMPLLTPENLAELYGLSNEFGAMRILGECLSCIEQWRQVYVERAMEAEVDAFGPGPAEERPPNGRWRRWTRISLAAALVIGGVGIALWRKPQWRHALVNRLRGASPSVRKAELTPGNRGGRRPSSNGAAK
jgi:hypothetical protein